MEEDNHQQEERLVNKNEDDNEFSKIKAASLRTHGLEEIVSQRYI